VTGFADCHCSVYGAGSGTFGLIMLSTAHFFQFQHVEISTDLRVHETRATFAVGIVYSSLLSNFS